MSETPLNPEQFARLMSLAPDHPERIAWSGRPEFESMRALYEKFEGTQPSGVLDSALREAEVDLKHRFRDALASVAGVDAASHSPVRAERKGRPWWGMGAPVFAMAAALMVVVAGVWLAARPRSTVLRGSEDTPVILEPRRVADDLEVTWTPVAGATSYRLSFVDRSMREIAAVEDWPGTSYLLKASVLPPGLEHGVHVFIQVQAVRGGAAVGAVPTKSIVVP